MAIDVDRNIRYNRERKIQNEWAKRDFDKERMLEELYRETAERLQRKIDEQYLKYAKATGLTRAEAQKVIKGMDVPTWAKEAAKAVKYRDFSPETNKWLKAYNNRMYISRWELLKAEIDIELQKLHSEEHYLINKHLEDEYIAELERQAGILGNSATGSVERVKQVVNADFYGTNFSESVWGRNGLYQVHKREIFGSLNRMYTDMDGYKKERKYLMDRFNIKEREAMRLLKTESSRIRSQAQEDSYKQNEFTHYRYVAEPGACKVCVGMANKIFKVEEFEVGVTAAPVHPNCRCSTYGIIEMKRKDGTSNID